MKAVLTSFFLVCFLFIQLRFLIFFSYRTHTYSHCGHYIYILISFTSLIFFLMNGSEDLLVTLPYNRLFRSPNIPVNFFLNILFSVLTHPFITTNRIFPPVPPDYIHSTTWTIFIKTHIWFSNIMCPQVIFHSTL